MARAYCKAYFDWIQQMDALSDAEKGRLFTAILYYAQTGITAISGRESILFPSFKAQIDRDIKCYETSVKNGQKGGAPVGNTNASKTTKNNLKQPKTTKNKDKELSDRLTDTTTPKKIDISTPRACEEEPEDCFCPHETDEDCEKFNGDFARVSSEFEAAFGRKMTLQEDCAIETLMIERGAVYIMAALQRCKGREIRSPVDYISSAVKSMD